MFSVLDALELHSKIINYQAEHGGAPYVALEDRGELIFVVAVLSESLLEELVDQYSRFRKSMPVHLDF